jgi:hypothetical protein
MLHHHNEQADRQAVLKVEVAEAWALLLAVLVLEVLVGAGVVEALKAPAIQAVSVKASLGVVVEVQEVPTIPGALVSRNLAAVGHIVNHLVLLAHSTLGVLEFHTIPINGNVRLPF